MKEAFDKLDRLLKVGNFRNLGKEDQQWVESNLGGEEAFDGLYEATNVARNERTSPVRSQVKVDLMKKFKAKHQPRWKLVLQWKMPAYAAVLLTIGFTSVIATLLPEKQQIVEKYVYQDPIIDTVFVASIPDTVIIERTVERPIYVKVFADQEESAPSLAVERKSKGKSLADQSEIKDILVSGR